MTIVRQALRFPANARVASCVRHRRAWLARALQCTCGMSSRASRSGQLLSRVIAAVGCSIVLVVELTLGSCGEAQPTATASSEPVAPASSGAEQAAPASPPAREPDVGWHMRASFWDTLRARDALIEGDLAEAQRAADHLAQTDYSRMLPAQWKHWVAALQQHAAALALAPNLSAAAQELGRMALTCGECHELHETGPDAPRANPLPWEEPPDTVEDRMHRHQLGVVQMWDGLVLPSEKAWRNGTVTITRAPLRAPERADQPIDDALAAQIQAVRELAKQARLATTYQERGRVYGELIARCAQCHYTERPARAHVDAVR